MRIVTRPDFDGIVCAALLKEAVTASLEIVWMEPNDIQSGSDQIRTGDIMANLPWHPNATLWFDHHVSNAQDPPVPGAFAIAPSAAGVVYGYYRDKGLLTDRFDELIRQTDMIDSADLTREQVNAPEEYPYILLSMTVQNHGFRDIVYWDRLVDMLRTRHIDHIMKDAEVAGRCRQVIKENKVFGQYLKDHTTITGKVSVTDFRPLSPVPSGNRFLTYALFPETMASMKIRYKDPDSQEILVSVGHSIFNRTCRVNVGQLLSRYGGGGHAGAGGCTLSAEDAQEKIDEILDILTLNQPL